MHEVCPLLQSLRILFLQLVEGLRSWLRFESSWTSGFCLTEMFLKGVVHRRKPQEERRKARADFGFNEGPFMARVLKYRLEE